MSISIKTKHLGVKRIARNQPKTFELSEIPLASLRDLYDNHVINSVRSAKTVRDLERLELGVYPDIYEAHELLECLASVEQYDRDSPLYQDLEAELHAIYTNWFIADIKRKL